MEKKLFKKPRQIIMQIFIFRLWSVTIKWKNER